jgi:hypothetical protein
MLHRKCWSMSITVSLLANECAIAKMAHCLAMDVMMVGDSGWSEISIAKNHYRRKHSDPLSGFRRSVKAALDRSQDVHEQGSHRSLRTKRPFAL